MIGLVEPTTENVLSDSSRHCISIPLALGTSRWPVAPLRKGEKMSPPLERFPKQECKKKSARFTGKVEAKGAKGTREMNMMKQARGTKGAKS